MEDAMPAAVRAAVSNSVFVLMWLVFVFMFTVCDRSFSELVFSVNFFFNFF